jgi:hypothetical protein
VVAHACNPSYVGSLDRRFQATIGNTKGWEPFLEEVVWRVVSQRGGIGHRQGPQGENLCQKTSRGMVFHACNPSKMEVIGRSIIVRGWST